MMKMLIQLDEECVKKDGKYMAKHRREIFS